MLHTAFGACLRSATQKNCTAHRLQADGTTAAAPPAGAQGPTITIMARSLGGRSCHRVRNRGRSTAHGRRALQRRAFEGSVRVVARIWRSSAGMARPHVTTEMIIQRVATSKTSTRPSWLLWEPAHAGSSWSLPSSFPQPCVSLSHTMPHCGAHVSLRPPTMMGEGTSPPAWMPSTESAMANERIGGGTSSMIARVIPADEPKVKKTPPKRRRRKRGLERAEPTVAAHKMSSSAPTAICQKMTLTIAWASRKLATAGGRPSASLARWRLDDTASVRSPPIGVPNMPANATQRPKSEAASTSWASRPSAIMKSGPNDEMPMVVPVKAA
mmetsp:Transcript_40757/g.107782  ORF Transcript_40757/g.107782 Transcript_40757/m.107782 type:complete len:327 (-) Transcript_40757:464-1444(-)